MIAGFAVWQFSRRVSDQKKRIHNGNTPDNFWIGKFNQDPRQWRWGFGQFASRTMNVAIHIDVRQGTLRFHLLVQAQIQSCLYV